MPVKFKTFIISVIISGFFCNYKLSAQVAYLHENDSVKVRIDNSFLPLYIYNEGLLQEISSNDSISIWVFDADTCSINTFAGIPFCKTCNVAANVVMQTAYRLSYVNKKVIPGSCWDYVNEIYTMISTGDFRKNDVFSSKKSGPYAPLSMLQPGDWIYHVNYQFYEIEHSAIFICWKDYEKGIAITLSYIGMNKWQTAKFGEYDLKSVYAVFRMQDEY